MVVEAVEPFNEYNRYRLLRRITAFIHEVDKSGKWTHTVPGAEKPWAGSLVYPGALGRHVERELHVYDAEILMDSETSNSVVPIISLPVFSGTRDRQVKVYLRGRGYDHDHLQEPDKWTFINSSPDKSDPRRIGVSVWELFNPNGFPKPATVRFYAGPDPVYQLGGSNRPREGKEALRYEIRDRYWQPRVPDGEPPTPSRRPTTATARLSTHAESTILAASTDPATHTSTVSGPNSVMYGTPQSRFEKRNPASVNQPDSAIRVLAGDRPNLEGHLMPYELVKRNYHGGEGRKPWAAHNEHLVELIKLRIVCFLQSLDRGVRFRGKGFADQCLDFTDPVFDHIEYDGQEGHSTSVLRITCHLHGMFSPIQPQVERGNEMHPAHGGYERYGFILPGQDVDPRHLVTKRCNVEGFLTSDGATPFVEDPPDVWTFSSRRGLPISDEFDRQSLHSISQTTWTLSIGGSSNIVIVNFFRPLEHHLAGHLDLATRSFELGRGRVRVLKSQQREWAASQGRRAF
ncbi:hypothetical protein JCM11641_008336 [Rhodosporidiobolus odoratus]